MPSKNNTKGSGAKNQAKAPSQSHAKTGNGSAANMMAIESTQADSKPLNFESKQPLAPNVPGIDDPRQELDLRPQVTLNDPNREGGVNKKKQKRRLKEAAKRAAEVDGHFPETEEVRNGTFKGVSKQPPTYHGDGKINGYVYEASDYDEPDHYEPDEPEDMYYTDEAAQQNHLANPSSGSHHLNGNSNHKPDLREDLASKSKKKRKNKSNSASAPDIHASTTHNHNSLPHPPPPPPSPPPLTPGNSYTTPNPQHNYRNPKQQNIWNTSTTEERENIKEFWLSLGEEDRRSLVKVEKEAVLKKMKEQQKYSCSCTVCGRKRTAIEEELEVLYDAYYEELEQYANKEQIGLENGPPTLNQTNIYHPMSRQRHRASHALNQPNPRGRLQEIGDGDDLGDVDEESDLGEEDDLSDDYDNSEEPPPLEEPPPPNSAETDFFNFGSSLTVQGGILTVADDLLKNDGKKFIEMMEQLAERRMQREEDAESVSLGLPMQHSHTGNIESELLPDEEDDEEDYDSGEEDEFEEDDMETMSEGQRMEEGRRMFQIFAARMFEQRVLTAYREKMAFERQQKLIEEVENEKTLEDQQKAKKLKEAQKKKDKKRQQKQAKEEERAKREAELAAQEAAAKAIEEKKAEELRQKKEEQRKKKEAEKKALEDEKQRKEAEKQRRQQEAREQQQEVERKQREQKEREKRKKEDAKKKEREEREAKEQEAKDKKEREASEQREREIKSKIDAKIDDTVKPAGHTLQNLPVRPPLPTTTSSAATTITVPPSGLIPPLTSSIPNSPHLPIAVPLVPKAPTPMRARQPSFQDVSAKSPRGSAPPLSSTTSPGAPSSIHTGRLNSPGGPIKQPTPPQPGPGPHRYPSRETSPGSIIHPPGYIGMPTTSGLGFSPQISELIQGSEHLLQHGSHGHHAGTGVASSGSSYNIGMNGPKSKSQSSMPPPPLNPTPGSHFGGIGQPISSHRGSVVSHTHSRNTSTSSNHGGGAQPNPISRPAPKQGPLSVEPNNHARIGTSGNSDLENGAHLGSSALLGDSDDLSFYEPRRGSMAPPGGNHNTRGAFGGPPGFPTAIGTSISRPGGMHSNGSTWSNQPSPFGATPSSPWPSTPGFGMQSAGSSGFGSIGSTAPQASSTQRAVTVRTLIANSCQKLSARSAVMGPTPGWHPVDAILRDVNMNKPQQYGPLEQIELLALCDTVGNTQNGGGIFDIHHHPNMGIFIRFTPGRTPSMSMGGEIGSPIGAPATGSMFGNNNHPRPSFS